MHRSGRPRLHRFVAGFDLSHHPQHVELQRQVLEMVQNSGSGTICPRRPATGPCGFTHCDVRVDNILVAKASVRTTSGSLTWEVCGWADSMWDVVSCVEMGSPVIRAFRCAQLVAADRPVDGPHGWSGLRIRGGCAKRRQLGSRPFDIGGRAVRGSSYERSGGWSKVSVQELERCPTQALAFGVSDEGSEWPAVSQAAGTDARFTVT